MRWARLVAILSVLFSVVLLSSGTAGAAASVKGGPAEVHTVHDTRCLDVYDSGRGPWVHMWACNNQANQKFYTVYYAGVDQWEIRTSDYWCVDGRWGKGASLERSPCTGHPGQRWRIVPHGAHNGWAIYSVQYPHLVWDIHGFGGGSKVQLWDGNGGSNQAWILTF